MFNKKAEETKQKKDSLIENDKKSPKKNFLHTFIALVLIVAVLGTVWGFGISYDSRKMTQEIKALESKISKMQKTGVILEAFDSEDIENFIVANAHELNILTNEYFLFTNTARFTNTDHIFSLPYNWTQESFIQQWDGTMIAGVDFTKAKVTVKKKVITIVLPYAEIISYELDRDTVKVFDETNNVFKRVVVKEGVNFDRETRDEMKARAIKSGLLTRTQKNAKRVVKVILENTVEDFGDYKTVFKFVDK